MERGELLDAIASYYDAFSSAMQRYHLSESLKAKYNLEEVSNLYDDEALFSMLKAKEVIDDSFSRKDFNKILELLNAAVEGRFEDISHEQILSAFENIMYQLEVLPILPGELPEENALTL